MSYDLDQPEERYRCVETEGPDRYNELMREHHQRQVVETVNGYDIRRVPSRFGILHMVSGTDSAFGDLAHARDHANSLPPGTDK